MRTHEQLVKKLMQRPGVRAEVERIERDETTLLDALLKARQDAGLTQAQVAERMGHPSARCCQAGACLGDGKALILYRNAAKVCQNMRQTVGYAGRVKPSFSPHY